MDKYILVLQARESLQEKASSRLVGFFIIDELVTDLSNQEV
jgi:hypothetical protein